MKQTKKNLPAFSRRGLLKGATALAAAVAPVAPVRAQTGGQTLVYVGAYTNRGRGIHIFDMDPKDGKLTRKSEVTGLLSPSSLAISPNRKYMYAVNEISNFGGGRAGSVTSLEIDANGDLRIMNTVSSVGPGPAYCSVDPTGKWVFAANYGGGSAVVLPVRADGSLGEATDLAQLPNFPLGRNPAQDAPPGSFSNSGHDAAHAHQAHLDPSGKFLFVSDLGTDRVYIFHFDSVNGKLTPNEQPWIQATNGAGPRHFEFHPNGRRLYIITEEAATMLYSTWDPDTGTGGIQQSESTLPPGYAGSNYPSAIWLSKDGNVLYGLNRWHNSIVIFDLNPDGWMFWRTNVWTQGDYPRDFAVEPGGRFAYVAHSNSDNVTGFLVDPATGGLTFNGQWVPVGNPSSIKFLQL